MQTEDQGDAIAFLTQPATHGTTGAVEIVDTHISRIFLVGDRAYKMTRALRLPYADFSTPARRLVACRREAALHAPAAPGLYLGVRRITRESGGTLVWDGTGPLVDAVVAMRRFDSACLFSNMAHAGTLTPQLLTATANVIADLHEAAPRHAGGAGAALMASVLDVNAAAFRSSEVFGTTEINALDTRLRQALARHAAVLNHRAAAGKVRRCHGDLHLRNICLLDGTPRLFDCIEFNDEIATVDVLYDLAFLLMDLWHLPRADLANWTMNRYLDRSGDDAGLVLLPFFMAVRAAVRAHVLATQAGDAARPLAQEARGYHALALDLLRPAPACLVAIGGFSGSGKSTVADALAAHLGTAPGARVIESDRVRKALHGVSAQTRLPPTAYGPDASATVYAVMAARASSLLSAGGSAVVNAVFDQPQAHERIEAVAREHGLRFRGFWLHAPAQVLRQRVAQRVGSASDATLDVLERQLAQDSGAAPMWQRLDATQGTTQLVSEILDELNCSANQSVRE